MLAFFTKIEKKPAAAPEAAAPEPEAAAPEAAVNTTYLFKITADTIADTSADTIKAYVDKNSKDLENLPAKANEKYTKQTTGFCTVFYERLEKYPDIEIHPNRSQSGGMGFVLL